MHLIAPVVSAGFIARFFLGAFVIIITYTTLFCFTAPILSSSNINEHSRNGFVNVVFVTYNLAFMMVLTGFFHAIVCLTYPSPPSLICPGASNLSSRLFTWNWYSAACITLMLFSSQVLLLSFTQLGQRSNFQSLTPSKLRTTGLYRWLQHPTYLATFVIFVANVALIWRRDGVAACWLPNSIVNDEDVGRILGAGYLLLVVFGCWVMSKRVSEEEATLKKTFGMEWERYHHATKRFIPGVF